MEEKERLAINNAIRALRVFQVENTRNLANAWTPGSAIGLVALRRLSPGLVTFNASKPKTDFCFGKSWTSKSALPRTVNRGFY